MKTYLSLGKQWGLRCLCFFLAVLLLALGLGTLLFAEMGGYTLNEDETRLYTFQNITESKCYDVREDWERKNNYGVNEYSLSPDFRGNTHFKVRILDPLGKVLYMNVGTWDKTGFWEETAVTMPIYQYTPADTDADVTYKYYDTYAYYGYKINNEDTHLYTIEAYYGHESITFDHYDMLSLCICVFHPIRYLLPVILLILGITLLFLLYRLAKHTGHRQYLPDHPLYQGDVVLTFFDRIPTDLYLFGLGMLFAFCAALLDPLFQMVGENLVYLALWSCVALVLVMLVCLLAAFITLVTRWKAHSILQNTICWRVCKLAWKLWLWCWRYIKVPFVRLGMLCRAIPLIWQVAIVTPIVLLLYALLSLLMLENFAVFFLWMFCSAVVYLVILYAAYSFRLLMKAGRALAEGDLRYKTDTKYLTLAFRSHGVDLNRIGEGMEKALSEKIKSERFKTELITNVSHDIKTPLTSIINYTDLLSREPLEGKAQEYTAVLSRQSARLKKLIEDLIEASKASTGNIAVSLERLDVCQIVRQSLGEYSERLESHSLRVIETIPTDEIFAMVDGRQLWRVLDNLYSNVCKYALEGTRVYVIVVEDGGEVTISVKNISRDPLVTAADELTERFVQGDSSRASEGSGLGLNIAKSLTELQHGKFTIRCDGDLFRCDVTFPVVS